MDSVTTPRGAGWDAAAAWYVVRMGLKAWAWDADSPAPSELTAFRVRPHYLGADLDTSPSGTVVNKQDMDTGTTHARKKRNLSSPFKPRDARAAQAPTPSSLRADSASLVAGRVLRSNFPDRTGSDDAWRMRVRIRRRTRPGHADPRRAPSPSAARARRCRAKHNSGSIAHEHAHHVSLSSLSLACQSLGSRVAGLGFGLRISSLEPRASRVRGSPDGAFLRTPVRQASIGCESSTVVFPYNRVAAPCVHARTYARRGVDTYKVGNVR